MSIILARSASNTVVGSITTASTAYAVPAISKDGLVAPATTSVIDTLDMSHWLASNWFVSIISSTKVQYCEVFATHRFGANPSLTIFNIIGDTTFQYDINVIVSGGNLEFVVTNNESENINVYITRFAVPKRRDFTNVIPTINIESMTAIISPSSSGIVDWISDQNIIASKWYIVLYDGTNTSSTNIVSVYNPNTSSIATQQYGWSSNYLTIDSFNISFTPTMNMGLQLSFSNADLSPYRIDVTRIPIEIGATNYLRNPMSSGNVSLWLPSTVVVPSFNTTIIDNSVNIDTHKLISWYIHVSDNVSLCTAFKVTCLVSDVNSNISYCYVGDSLDISYNLSIDGDILILSLTNNTSTELTINLIHMPVLS